MTMSFYDHSQSGRQPLKQRAISVTKNTLNEVDFDEFFVRRMAEIEKQVKVALKGFR